MCVLTLQERSLSSARLALTRQMGQTYSGSTSASAMWEEPIEMLRRSRTSLMLAVLAENAFLTSSDAPSGGVGSASPGSPAWHTLPA